MIEKLILRLEDQAVGEAGGAGSSGLKRARVRGFWGVSRGKDYLVVHPTARKWVITPVISGFTLLIPFKTHLQYPLVILT